MEVHRELHPVPVFPVAASSRRAPAVIAFILSELYVSQPSSADLGGMCHPSASVEDFATKSVRPCHMVSGVHYRCSEGWALELQDRVQVFVLTVLCASFLALVLC